LNARATAESGLASQASAYRSKHLHRTLTDPVDLETIVSLAKRRGFVFQSSEIYGGLGSVWDYGPLGVEMKRNVKDAWWRAMVRERDDIVGIDAAILMDPRVWVASGHVAGFTDPLVECDKCHRRFRQDAVPSASGVTEDESRVGPVSALASGPSGQVAQELRNRLEAQARSLGKRRVTTVDYGDAGDYPPGTVPCPQGDGGFLGEPRQFNLMFKTFMGPVEDDAARTYLRPETAQGIFVNYENVQTTTRRKLPFGIAQIGKSFRNEITPGNFIFRTREFEQMEMEYFCQPDQADRWFDHWVEFSMNFFKRYGIRAANLRTRVHTDDERPHYAKAALDVEYNFSFGWAELETINNRTDYDLSNHEKHSGRDLKYFDEETKAKFLPYVIEPAMGADRTMLAILVDAYDEEPGEKEKRVVMRLHPDIAPIAVAVLPLSRNDKLMPTARRVHEVVRPLFNSQFDDTQSIGRRYRRQDEIGTPLCVTVDFDTVEKDSAVTIRDRDSMEQVRVPIDGLVMALRDRLDVVRQRVAG
jgi:glycyl-tRNA synthetase